MKNIKYYIGAFVTTVVAMTSCSPDSFDGADPNGIPTIEGVKPTIVVDQEINQVTFTLPSDMKGVMPVWIFTENKGTDNEKKTYSTVNGLKRIFAKAGDYDVEMKLMNRNGVSDGTVKASYHIDNTIMSFDKYLTFLTGGTSNSSKEWRIDNEKAQHLGCGPSGTTGTEWWSAGPDEKAAFGVYDNRLVFTSDYKYTFNPGAAGTMYVNYGTTALNTSGATEDFTMPVSEAESEYSFEVEGDQLYLTLPAHTPFPYIANDEIWESPRYKVESMTANAIELVSDNGNIAWHYSLTSGAAKVQFNGFNYAHAANIWRPIDEAAGYTTSFYYAPGWNQIADPGFAQNGDAYTFTLPSATSDQWQAQCFLVPNSLVLNSGTNYDFSCVINSSTDIKGVTIKLTDKASDSNFLFTERVDVKAYEDYVFYLSDLPGIDGDCKLVFDFGGNGDNCTVNVSRITLKDHSIDDGTVLPSVEPVVVPSVDWREADNLLAGMNKEITYYYAPGWAQIANPETTEVDGGYTLSLPAGTTDQWQCQFTFANTGVSLSADKKYDYRVIINSSNPIKGVTVKLTQDDNDKVFLTADRHDVNEAYTDQVIELVGLEGQDISNLKIVYDFGGNPEGTEVTVKGMLLQEHKATADELEWVATDADNLWGEALYPNSFHYAPGWNKIADPTIQTDGRKYMVSLPSATTDQWQAQVTTETEISTSADASYDFQVILTSDKDIKGVTVKLTKVGDDNVFYTADRHDLTAYEAKPIRFVGMPGLDIDKIKLVLDFAGNPDDTKVEVSDIILRKSK